MKIHSVGDELLHANRRTDMAKLIVAFRDYANALKKSEGKGFTDLRHDNIKVDV